VSWVELLETPVVAVEFEMLAPDGWITPSLIEVADGVRFHIDGKPLLQPEKIFREERLTLGGYFSHKIY
jgi:hypothetical protein